MTKKEQLIELLIYNKKDVDYRDENGNYDPNPYWLAEEIEKLYSIPLVGNPVCHICDEPYQHVHTEHKFERLCDC